MNSLNCSRWPRCGVWRGPVDQFGSYRRNPVLHNKDDSFIYNQLEKETIEEVNQQVELLMLDHDAMSAEGQKGSSAVAGEI